MNFGPVTTRLAFVCAAALGLAGCLGNTRPDVAFPEAVNVSSPRGGGPVAISGRVEASRASLGTLERRVVLTANGTQIGRGTLPDARLPDAANRPVVITGEFQGVPFSANCGNRQFPEPPGERQGIIHSLVFAEIVCQVSYAGRPAGTLSMRHSPVGRIVQPAALAASAR